MAFEIGDKVLTTTGLYISGEWRERGLKGKVVDISDEFGGLLTVKFKGISERRFLRPEYLILRDKKKEAKRPFKKGDKVSLTAGVGIAGGTFPVGTRAEVTEVIPDSNLVEIKLLSTGTPLSVSEEVLTKTEVVADEPADPDFETKYTGLFAEDESLIAPGATIILLDNSFPEDEDEWDKDVEITEGVIQSVDTEARTAVAELTDEGQEESYTKTLDFDEFTVVEPAPDKESPEVQDALGLILARIEEIKALLTQGPRTETVINIHPSNGLTEEQVAEALQEEEPAPEPVFKKAKNVVAGDLLYTEGGAYDKVARVATTKGGYTSLYGAFGNEIIQVPAGRQVQVLEEVA